MEQPEEIIEGYVVDLACVRRYPRAQLLERARAHTRNCVLMGHCVESGYALIDEDGELAVLDTHATPQVVQAVASGTRESGIRLRVMREKREGELCTTSVEQIP